MRKIFIILGVLIILDIAYFSFVNAEQMLTINYKPIIGDFQINSGFLYFLMGLYGVLGGFLLTYYKVSLLNEKLKKLSRNIEKTSIASEESSDKVKALQSKIDTLEMALKESLKKDK